MAEAVTRGVKVEVESFYMAEQSDAENDRYAFSYRIKLINESDRTVQLLTRHWVITDSSGKVRHVKGDGVVGQQPVMVPGADYEYTSGSKLDSPMGTMHGTYGMRDDRGATFDVDIPVFTLSTGETFLN